MEATDHGEQKQATARAVRNMSGIMGSRMWSLVLRTVASLIVARVAGPGPMGFVAWLGIFPVYATWLSLGVVNGAERRVPILRGQGRLDQVDPVWSAASAVNVAAMAVCVVAGAIAALLTLRSSPMDSLRWLAAGLLAAGSQWQAFVMSLLGTEKRFGLLGRLFLIEGVCVWVLLPLAWCGIGGLTLRALLTVLLPALLVWRVSGLFHRPRLRDWALLRDLAIEGLPVMVANFLLIFSYGLSRTLVGALMTDVDMGYFVIAMNIVQLVRIVQYSIGRVLLPRLGELHGRTGGGLREVARAVGGPLAAAMAICTAAGVAGWVLIEPVTAWVLPSYMPGVAAARATLPGMVLTAATGSYVFYVAVGRQRQLIWMFLAGVAVQAQASLWLFNRGHGLASFGWGFSAGMAVSAFLVNAGVLYYALRHSPRSGS